MFDTSQSSLLFCWWLPLFLSSPPKTDLAAGPATIQVACRDRSRCTGMYFGVEMLSNCECWTCHGSMLMKKLVHDSESMRTVNNELTASQCQPSKKSVDGHPKKLQKRFQVLTCFDPYLSKSIFQDESRHNADRTPMRSNVNRFIALGPWKRYTAMVWNGTIAISIPLVEMCLPMMLISMQRGLLSSYKLRWWVYD